MTGEPNDEGGAPTWYTSALERRAEVRSLDVDGTRISVRIWGPADGVPVVLVHGGAAHASWWDHIAPLLPGCRVVALDLSGHGDSAWRDDYRIGLWRDEVLAVVRSGLLRGSPLLVGHSLGGYVAYAMARSHGPELAGALIVDSSFPSRSDDAPQHGRFQRRFHPDRTAILQRFRLLPAARTRAPYTVSHVARESVIETADGWCWKFDPRIFEHDGIVLEDIEPVEGCPAVIVRGDEGLLTIADAEQLSRVVDGSSQSITIVDCGHHIPLDQPVALAAAIATAAKAWAPAGRLPSTAPSAH